jgi:hypothetical protein
MSEATKPTIAPRPGKWPTPAPKIAERPNPKLGPKPPKPTRTPR